MKRLFFILLFSITSLLFSQQEMLNANEVVFPTSPEASKFGKYGDAPVNLATGRINYSIPIYTINLGGYKYPISLSYNYSGFLAEQSTSLLGLGWDLMATGLISRQVIGMPDESQPFGYVGNEDPINGIGLTKVRPYFMGSLNGAEVQDLYAHSADGKYDTTPDKFIVRVNDLQVNFYLNEEAKPIIIPHKNVRIEFEDFLNDKITITNENGIKYIFEKNDVENTVATSNSSPPNIQNYISSWMLTSIKFPTTDKEINFEYDEYNYRKVSFSDSKTVVLSTHNCDGILNSGSTFNLSENTTIITSKILKRIIFPKGEIVFNNIITNWNSVQGGGALLNSIIIKDKYDNIIDKYNFYYSNSNPEKIRMLSNIERAKNTKTIPFYSFDYYNTIPSTNILYAQQDLWGYYNGKNNTNLVEGDRTPVFDKTLIGALKNIYYPTGGNTNITYELNSISAEEISPYQLPECDASFFNEIVELEVNNRGDETPHIVNDSKSFYIQERTTAKISFLAITSALPNTNGNGFAEVSVSVINDNGELILNQLCNANCGDTDALSNYENGSSFDEEHACFYLLESGNYTINIETFATGNVFAHGSVKVEYDNNADVQEDIVIGGLRVKKTINYFEENDTISKKYLYIKEDGVSSGLLLNRPINENLLERHIIYNGGNELCLSWSKTISSNSMLPLASFQGSPVLYKRIEEIQNGSSLNGKTIQNFSGGRNAQDTPPFLTMDNKDWRKGLLQRKVIFNRKNTILDSINKIANSYQLNILDFQNALDEHNISLSFKAQVKLSHSSNQATQYNKTIGFNIPEFYHLNQTKTIDYINGLEKTSTTTNFTYNSLNGYLKEKESTTSDGNIKTDYYYPTDKDQLTGLSTNSLNAIDELINQNRIENPIQTETYKNNELLSTQRSNYKDWGQNATGTANIILPETIKTSKGGEDLEPRITYHKYDTHGNPLEVSKADNPSHICYIWGYNHSQPIAKIENATYSDIEDLASFGTDFEITEYFSNTQENQLRSLLPNAMVTTYEYIPLVGVKTITQPNGEKIHYEYDNFNRLKLVKDSNGNILKENEYHYKTTD